ncbi:MraY family glycosyltransferase [Spelaeicoccus albus]|uniref:UDP-N-acetylmuramyl pentapeptide phosphotransferase/UDP-N-acetylglucosamine-1-phosphate transferase n=1 Tax=Spelaeicoccus albus TaxID=1280376 RepID=A0A7Z0AAR9_9MICO|nr:hypothetical protein [Spelaeicoccus albus]NYI66455.1 UDP-N-acetylmuramyl pentapeptide phosphotransferase/UDP-N-acetylglucosamine-1-phosphate transferase [Spelaeicoccus albus]
MILAFLVAGTVAAVVTALTLAVAVPQLNKHGIIDVPSDRSSHAAPITRGGGIAPVIGVVTGIIAGWLTLSTAMSLMQTAAALMIAVSTIVFVLVFAGFGFAEDVLGLHVGSRLALQLVVSAFFAVELIVWSGHSWAWLPIIAVSNVVGVNFTNFMDGINGITSLFAAVAGAWFLIVEIHGGEPTLACISLVLLVAALVFLPSNAPRAKVFMGDVGSYGIGAAVCAVVCWLIFTGVSLPVALAPVVLYLSDAGFTLVRRSIGRENLADAHRTHVYQRLTDLGYPHIAVTLMTVGVSMALCTLSTAFLFNAPVILRLLAIVTGAIIVVAYLASPRWLRPVGRRHRQIGVRA